MKGYKKQSAVLIFTLLLTAPVFVFAAENLDSFCQIENIEKICTNIEPAECRKNLEKCQAYYDEQSDKITKDITKTEQEKKTLQNKVSSLKKQIDNLNYNISKSNLIIKDLTLQITDTSSSIDKTTKKIEDLKVQLSDVLKSVYQEDQKSIIETLFAEEELSGFFDNLVSLEKLNTKTKDFLQDIKGMKDKLEGQKLSLDSEKGDLETTVKLQTLQKEESSKTKSQNEYYLSITETEYQKQLKIKEETDKKAAQIRARIFEMIGVSKAPTFGEAYEIAKYVSGVTGVRPQLVLAILTQESNLGQNVGQCYLKNKDTGAGIRVKTGATQAKVMNPTRDVPCFLAIAQESGKDPFNTYVSCPMSYGWGGAMGPGQFIPSTWNIYKDKIKSITNKPADPWNINDAFLGTALYLADYGAKKQTYDAEWKAAMIYFSGSTNTKYRFYGDSVMKIAAGYEDDIKAIENGR
jgi:membrane-bound lytic murein transglycosylase B